MYIIKYSPDANIPGLAHCCRSHSTQESVDRMKNLCAFLRGNRVGVSLLSRRAGVNAAPAASSLRGGGACFHSTAENIFSTEQLAINALGYLTSCELTQEPNLYFSE